MRRITRIAALAALALLATAAAASAAVTYDGNSLGSVSKGDVQSALGGINDATLQSKWKSGEIKFTSEYQMDSIDQWTCSDGSIGQRTLRTVQAKPLNVTPITNAQGKVTSGWTLNGVNNNVAGSFLRGERIGTMYECPAGSYFTGFAPHVFENTVLPGVYVNGTYLPITPVEAPAV